jgi:putative transposase
MPNGLHRYYGNGHLHFVTCSCYHRQRWLDSARRRNRLVRILEESRLRYRFVVVGYVVMPEHIHLLIGEPKKGTVSTVMQVVKQRYARQIVRKRKREARQTELWAGQKQQVWQSRFYDFNVWTERKRAEKLHYMHRGPVEEGLVLEPVQWE